MRPYHGATTRHDPYGCFSLDPRAAAEAVATYDPGCLQNQELNLVLSNHSQR